MLSAVAKGRIEGLNMKFIDDAAIIPAGEEVPAFEVSDEALEAAAGSMTVKAAAFTMAFCSGVNSCPAIQMLRQRQ